MKVLFLIKRYLNYVIIVFWVIVAIVVNRVHLFEQLDPLEYGAKYSKSQYILGEASKAKISDSELYVYASHAYMLGEDPTKINFEHPPHAKYYYGIFFKLFGNPYWGSVVVYCGVLLLIKRIATLLSFGTISTFLVLLLSGTLSLLRVHTERYPFSKQLVYHC